MRTTRYETPFGCGRLVWKNGLLVAHHLPVPASERAAQKGRAAKDVTAQKGHAAKKDDAAQTGRAAKDDATQTGRAAQIKDLVRTGDASRTGAETHIEAAGRIASLLEKYFNGRAVDFEPEKFCLDCSEWSPFEADTAEALWKVPYGEQITYARLADRAGHPGAHRAVGNFMAKNPFPVLLPCHRVVRGDGNPGGFSGGAKWKKTLTEIEAGLPAAALIK